MTRFYLLMCVLGTALPFSSFLPWITTFGFDLPLIWQGISHPLSAFAWLDVVVSALVLFGFIIVEGRRLRMSKLWLPILATCIVGVSLGLPLFLYLRERQLNETINAKSDLSFPSIN
ncbi:DUF2834 domain-containing protein [Marinomonas gallaica]|uniref:DUF2834 domain-containing protein n=1 Tax=Marinomonas gallaica TaxID=1806667 RepID=UPI003CE47B2D